ncbi:MAG: epoxyqueuosine reductase [Desulfatirhabdiaceae bacterium]
MNLNDIHNASEAIIKMAKELGASLAGFARVDDLKSAPSFTFAPQMPGAGEGIGTRKNALGLKPGQVAWPESARSLLVIAVAHPEDKPDMDWWFGAVDPPGNRILARIVKQLGEWISATYPIRTVHLPYHIEKGGTFLKDVAVLAGLGCIGKNNILVTPEYGPRVRLRALTLDVLIPPTGPSRFDPCARCDAPCRRACPRGAFDTRCYESKDYGQSRLPGRTGDYSRPACNIQMEQDCALAVELQIEGFDAPVKVIKYCRACELNCPVGRG